MSDRIKRLVDPALAAGALLLSAPVRSLIPVGAEGRTPDFLQPVYFYITVAILWVVLAAVVGLYGRRRSANLNNELFLTTAVAGLTVLALAGVHDLLAPSSRHISRIQLVVFAGLLWGLVIGYRLAASLLSREQPAGPQLPQAPAPAVPAAPSRRPILAAVGRLYALAAMAVFTPLLLLALVNLGEWAYERAVTARQEQARLRAVQSKAERLAPYYPGYTVEEIADILNNASSVDVRCSSFTHYQLAAYDSSFVEVDPAGFRHVRDQAPWPPDPEAYSIFVFGGSTTYGFQVANDHTVPSYLQEALREAGHDVSVYNFAQYRYFSTQEMALFQKLIREGFVPDAAIFVDGLNEFFAWNDEPAWQTKCGEQALITEDRLFVDFSQLPIVRLVPDDLYFEEPQTSGSMPPLDDRAANQAVLDRWYVNKAAIEAIARVYGIDVLFVWEPVPMYRYDQNPTATDVGAYGIFARAQYGYALVEDSLRGNAEQTERILFLGGIQEDRSDRLYLDSIHYTPDFAREVGGLIADEVVRQFLAGATGRSSP